MHGFITGLRQRIQIFARAAIVINGLIQELAVSFFFQKR